MSRKLVCVCNFVSERELLKAIENGALDLEEIKLQTSAGTSCGRCHAAINHLLGEAVKNPEYGKQKRLF